MLAKLWEDKVQQYPERIAVQTNEGQITYTQLNQAANRTARSLLYVGAGAEPVALLFEHGTGMIIGLLGALKAGLSYVPLDPTYPEKRLQTMVEHSDAGIILTNQYNLAVAERIVRHSARPVQIVNIDRLSAEVSPENLDLTIAADRMAYILYTSGSTGNPKGVIQTHENIWYFIQRYTATLQLTPGDRLTLFSSFSHDAAVMDIYSGLLNGATLYPLNLKNQVNVADLASWLLREKITIWHSVPTLYRYFLKTLHGDERFPDLRFIVLGGEGVLEYDVLQTQERFPSTVLINLYGQSESSYNSYQWIDTATPFRKVNLGEPVEGTELLVVTEEGEEALPLEEGEILVVSDHLALGYWKDPEKTSEVFLDHPEVGRMYRTGDLGKLLVNSRIEYLGRKDFQVKIRGYRIELGEVESQLLQHPAIRDAVLVAREDANGNRYLVAFFVKREEVAEPALREYLEEHLPDYMVPAFFSELAQIPLTPNNKVDRKALLQMDLSLTAAAEHFVPPTTETERVLVAIWEEILGQKQIGVHDNFFSRGGNSLLATQLVAKIYRSLKVEVPLREIFQLKTIAEMAGYIQSAAQRRYVPIPVVEASDFYPVSSAQKRLYILHQLEPDSLNYNMPRVMILEGELVEDRLTAAFQRVIARHESLRTSYHTFEGEIVQIVHPEVSFTVEFEDVVESEVESLVRAWVRPFDLRQAPLLRTKVLKLQNRWILLCDLHHSIADGTSMTILLKEFWSLYAGRSLPELPIQYKDYAVWQNSFSASEEWQKQEEYWLRRFAGEIPVLAMPTDYPRPAEGGASGEEYRFALVEARPGLALAEKAGVTVYMLLLAAYNLFLAKYTGQEEIIVGTPTAGRPHPDVENLLGMFVNTLALRNWPTSTKTFLAFLAEVKEHAIEAFENQSYPFETLVEKLAIRRDLSRNPLFDTMFMLQNIQSSVQQGESGEDQSAQNLLRLTPYPFSQKTVKFDLELSALIVENTIQFTFHYRTDLFKSVTIERFAAHYLHVLAEVTRDPEQLLATFDLLDEVEKRRLLAEYCSGEKVELGDETVHQIIARNARHYPDRMAIRFEGADWSYQQVNALVNHLARIFRQTGLTTEGLVGIYLERSPWMVISILAIWKAGGAYIPLDSRWPKERVQGVLTDAGAQILVTSLADLPLEVRENFAGTVIDLEQALEQARQESAEDVGGESQLHKLAYVIYTSGSTGKPKGVMVEHRGMLNHMQAKIRDLHLDSQSRIAQTASHAFDISLWQFFTALLVGGQTVIVPAMILLEPFRLIDLLEEERVTVLELVPSYLGLLLDGLRTHFRALPGLQYLITTGEAVKPELVRRCFALYPEKKLVNAYGPTEASDRVTHHIMEEAPVGHHVPIGKPLQNLQIYIVNKNRQLCPVGVRGEICIAGSGVGRGYLHDPERTAKAFSEDPYSDAAGIRLYRTGDLGRWLADGVIEYMGREDHQVKIRGFRIELGEIESRLVSHPLVREAVVVERDDSAGNKYLVAYLVLRGGVEVSDRKPEAGLGTRQGSSEEEDRPNGSGEDHWEKDGTRGVTVGEEKSLETRDGETVPEVVCLGEGQLAEIQADLAKSLPEYMVPTQWIVLERLPLNSNGKVDRKALPFLAKNVQGGEVEPPTTSLEKELAAIWRELLGVKQIGLKDSFFHLGGHSLKVISLLSRAGEQYGVQLSLKDFFADPTLRGMSRMLENGGTGAQGVPGLAELYVPFNTEQEKQVFCFPPGRGFGLAYVHLAASLLEYALIGFNFITQPERLTQYVQEISELAPEGPLCLLGYSAGGTLAFEVAEELARRGRKVSDLILLDAPKVNVRYRTTDERHQAALSVVQYLEGEAEYAAWLESSGAREAIIAKVESYLQYSSSVKITGTIDADIHFIQAEGRLDSNCVGDGRVEVGVNMQDDFGIPGVESEDWRSSTTGNFRVYQGYGVHGVMLNRGFAEKNGELIQRILQQR